MRKLLIILFIIGFASTSFALPTLRYERDAAIGTTKACDNIPYATLTDTATYDGATCVVTTTAGVRSVYVWDAAETDAEGAWITGVDPVEADDDGGGAGRWILTTSLIMGRTSQQTWSARDSDCTDDDVNGEIYLNCTATGTGAEECGWYKRVQTGGTITIVSRDFAPEVEAFTTEADLTIVAEVVLLDGDNDTDNDTLQLQPGDFPGQTVKLIAYKDIDINDTVTIDTSTDTACTNCPAIVFDFIGENAVLIWADDGVSGTTWILLSLVDDYS